MKQILIIFSVVLLVSCKGNTIYEKPKDLIPKDTMIMLLQDLYIARSAKEYKNTNGKNSIDYTFLLHEKYKIDTNRFISSNIYYTSKLEVYEQMFKEVHENLDTLIKIEKAKIPKDSLSKKDLDKTEFEDDDD